MQDAPAGADTRRANGNLWRLFTVSLVTGFSGAIMPGPLMVAAIEQTAIQGLRAVIGLITGHMLLEVVIVLLLASGLQTVIARPRVRGAIGLVGGAALVYMGIDMLRHAFELKLDLSPHSAAAYSFGELLFFGAAICAANPYFTGWWATIGAGQMAQMAPRTRAEYAAFFLGHESADYIWYGFLGVLVVTGRRLLTDDVYQWIIAACGVFIAVLGARFVLTGWRMIVPRRRQAGTEDAS